MALQLRFAVQLLFIRFQTVADVTDNRNKIIVIVLGKGAGSDFNRKYGSILSSVVTNRDVDYAFGKGLGCFFGFGLIIGDQLSQQLFTPVSIPFASGAVDINKGHGSTINYGDNVAGGIEKGLISQVAQP